MNPRGVLVLVLLALPAAALLALGPSGRAPVPAGRIVVRYWANWTGVEGAAVQRLVDRYNTSEGARDGIWVDYNAMGDVDKRMLIAAAGGAPPDVAGLSDRFIASYAEQDALLPLDELAHDANVALDELKPIWLKLCRYRGTLYALPSTPFTIALFYNRAAFREAGLDPDQPPRTPAELNEFALRLTKKSAAGHIERLGFTVSPAMLGWWHWAWPHFFGAELWDGAHFALDSPATSAALHWIAEFRAAVDNARVLQFEGAAGAIESAQNPFFAGKLAMVFQGPWFANWARSYAPDLDYGVAPFPSAVPGRQPVLASTDLLVIPRGCPHPREAMRFIAFLLRQENIEQLCKDHGKVSPYRSPLPSFFQDHPNPFVRVFDSLADSPDAFGAPAMPTVAETWTEMLYLLENVIRDARPTAQALRAAQARIDQIVDEHRRKTERRRGSAE